MLAPRNILDASLIIYTGIRVVDDYYSSDYSSSNYIGLLLSPIIIIDSCRAESHMVIMHATSCTASGRQDDDVMLLLKLMMHIIYTVINKISEAQQRH